MQTTPMTESLQTTKLQQHQTPSQSLSPIFLVGAERSGTTLLRIMLKHHPQIAWCKEFEYAIDQLSPRGEWPDLRNYSQWLSTHRIFLSTGYTIDPALDYPGLIGSFLEQERRSADKPIIGATVHRHYDRVLHIWPESRFIHLVRDPRDVARSCIAMGWAGNVWIGIKRWVEAERLWEDVCIRVPEHRRCEISFEDLITDPTIHLKRLCEFIGVEFDPNMLDYTHGSTYDKPDAVMAYKWRKSMSEDDVRLVENRTGGLLTQRGYEASGLAPLKVGLLRRWRLSVQNRWAGLQFHRNRLGTLLWLEGVIARRLPFRGWQDRVQVRCNEIDSKYIK